MIAATSWRPERGWSTMRRSPTTCETSKASTSLGRRYMSNWTKTARAVKACNNEPLARWMMRRSTASQGGGCRGFAGCFAAQ
eukprot:9467430-Pyramimonas_sp.AAC.1